MTSLLTSLSFATVGFALAPRFPYPRLPPKSFERFELHHRWNSFDTRFELIWLYPIPSQRIFFKIIGSRARFGRCSAGSNWFKEHGWKNVLRSVQSRNGCKTLTFWRHLTIRWSACELKIIIQDGGFLIEFQTQCNMGILKSLINKIFPNDYKKSRGKY